MTTTEIIKSVNKFIRAARRDNRPADVAYGRGALDALRGRPAAGKGSHHRDYLSGWSKVHGI